LKREIVGLIDYYSNRTTFRINGTSIFDTVSVKPALFDRNLLQDSTARYSHPHSQDQKSVLDYRGDYASGTIFSVNP